MNLFLIPFFILATLPNEIQLSAKTKITGYILKPGETIKYNNIGVLPLDWSILKSIVESSNKKCKNILFQTVDTCKIEIDRLKNDLNNYPQNQQLLIDALKIDIKEKNLTIKKNQAKIQVLKYVAIAAGTIAITSSAYIILK
tara:strand:+ start:844 stop:1269 length:426 start_codon:yes stop_codon:yes gene_type:complete